MYAFERQAGFGQPLLEIGNRRRIVIVEMRPRGEHLDCLESVARNLQQMITRQPLTVVEVRRHPEMPFRHNRNHSLYKDPWGTTKPQSPHEPQSAQSPQTTKRTKPTKTENTRRRLTRNCVVFFFVVFVIFVVPGASFFFVVLSAAPRCGSRAGRAGGRI